MAFKMNRPVIKGTPIHKASIAKAKAESIVAQTRTQADSSLVGAGNALGKSYIPAAVDYSQDLKAVKIPESKEKKSSTNNGDKKSRSSKETKQRKKDLKEEYEKERADGTLFPDGKTYDANGKEIKQKKVKEEKVDKEGTVVSRLFGRAKQAVQKKQADNKAKWEAEQKEKEKLNAEKLKVKTAKEAEQAKIDAENQAKIDAENLKKDNQKAKVKELNALQREKDAADRKQMNKKKGQAYELGSVKTDAFGGKQISQYTKEQKDRLEAEGVWSDEAEKMVLPEEIVDGEFVSQAKGTEQN